MRPCPHCAEPIQDAATTCHSCGSAIDPVTAALPPADSPLVPPLDLPPIPPSPTDDTLAYEPFSFTGNGHEYFRIWIVNILLSVITLGIYSPWAKVRRTQYFYRHVRVAGSGFDYHGNPIALLKGRIVATILFGGYYLASYLDPMAGLAAFAVLAAVMPWLIVQSLKFRLYNSSYRGLRFHFHGGMAEGYWVLIGLPLLSALTLFLLTPFWHQRLKRFQHANAAFGSTRFAFTAPVRAFYRAYLFTAICFAALALFSLFWIGVLAGFLIGAGPGQSPAATVAMGLLFLILYVALASALWSLTTAQVQNVVWRHTTIGRHQFTSTLEAHRLLGLVLTNTLATVVTLGLFKPYADVRMTRYMVDEMQLVTTGGFGEFVAAGEREVAAAGEAATEIFDIDLAF